MVGIEAARGGPCEDLHWAHRTSVESKSQDKQLYEVTNDKRNCTLLAGRRFVSER